MSPLITPRVHEPLRNAYETTNVVCENWFRCGLCSEANFEGGFALAPLFDLLV